MNLRSNPMSEPRFNSSREAVPDFQARHTAFSNHFKPDVFSITFMILLVLSDQTWRQNKERQVLTVDEFRGIIWNDFHMFLPRKKKPSSREIRSYLNEAITAGYVRRQPVRPGNARGYEYALDWPSIAEEIIRNRTERGFMPSPFMQWWSA